MWHPNCILPVSWGYAAWEILNCRSEVRDRLLAWSDKTEMSTRERKLDKASGISAFRCLVDSLWTCSYTFLPTSWIYSHTQEWTATLRCFLSLTIWIASFLFELIMRPYLIGLQPYRDRVAVDHFDSDFTRSPFGTARYGTAGVCMCEQTRRPLLRPENGLVWLEELRPFPTTISLFRYTKTHTTPESLKRIYFLNIFI